MARIDHDHGRGRVHCTVAYCGPRGAGKTTNLEVIGRSVPDDQAGGRLLRVRFAGGLLLEHTWVHGGTLAGLDVRLHLLALPDPGEQQTGAWADVLGGVDGAVFVVDSSAGRVEDAARVLEAVGRALADQRRPPDTFPFLLQANKQDLEDALAPETIERILAPEGRVTVPARATTGDGVLESLREVGLQVLARLSARYPFSGERAA